MKKSLFFSLLVSATLVGCAGGQKGTSGLTESGLDPQKFITDVNGQKTELFVLKNKNNMEVCVTNFGGRIVSIMVPDRDGNMQDVVLGFDSIQDYIKNPSDFGATIGRYANRIGQGRFTLDGTEYQLPQNNYGHCLHGGPNGFQYALFNGTKINDQVVKLTYQSKDMEEGFPGNLNCSVTMKLTDDNAIVLSYEATTDKPTVVNLTNHSYFNLDGNPANDNSDQLLYVNADSYTPCDSTFMTTGEILPVEGTPMDFRTPTAIGSRINEDFIQLKNGLGIDHNFVLNTKGNIDQVCASLESPKTGIKLEVFTDEPGIQIYTGNSLDGTLSGKKQIVYKYRTAVCLETQKYPDTPNKPDWPSCVLRPGEKYTSHTIFKFSVDK